MSELELLFKYLDAMGTLKVCAATVFQENLARSCVNRDVLFLLGTEQKCYLL